MKTPQILVLWIILVSQLVSCSSKETKKSSPEPYESLTRVGDFYDYTDLQLKDYDVMKKSVMKRVYKAEKVYQKSEDIQEAVEILRIALRMVFSRPNNDNMAEKLIPIIRRDLDNFNAYGDTIDGLVSEAIAGIKNDRWPTTRRSTYLFILENIMEEIQPYITEYEYVKIIYIRIRDEKLKIPKSVRNDRKLRSMYKSQPPSERAKRILRKKFPDEFKKPSPWWKFWG